MAHWTSTLALAFLCTWIFGCGDEFTAGFTPPGMLDEAGAAGAAEAGGAGALSSAGSAGSSAGTAAAQAGAPTEVGGTAGIVTAGAGAGGAAQAGAGGAPPGPLCEHAVDVSGGYLAVQLDRCYRTRDHFSLLLCGGWGKRTLKVNGVPAECNSEISLAPSTDGYNYIEMSGDPPGAWLRWLEYTPPVPCDKPLTLSSASGPLPAGPVCIRTTDALNEVLTDDATGRSLVINGFQTSYNYQTGVPPSADGYIYLSIGPGQAGSSVSWTFVPLPTVKQ